MTTLSYKHVSAYPMKVRLYLSDQQKLTVDEWLLGLQKAYNMTLYSLKNHEPMITCESKPDKNGRTALFPDFSGMQKKSWLDTLRGQNAHVKNVPGTCLSNNVGGLFCCDLKKAWESQGKLPVDAWFNKVDEKGHHVVRYYNEKKPRTSVYLQIPAYSITRGDSKSVNIKIPKIGAAKARGWNDKISFEEGHYVPFFDKYVGDSKLLGFRIVKDDCGDYYAVISFKDVYRPFAESEDKHGIGIDAGLDALLISSDGVKYENPRYHRDIQSKINKLRKDHDNEYGPINKKFRKDRKAARAFNTQHEEAIASGIVEAKYIKPSANYKKTRDKIARAERLVKRRRELRQHKYTAEIVRDASLVGIESLKVKNMMRNNNLAYSVADAAMSAALQKIKYKAAWSGVPVHAIGTFDASTQVCSNCGYRLTGDKKLTLADRTFICPKCGMIMDRDINASKSILNIAMKQIEDGIDRADETGTSTAKGMVRREKIIPKDRPLGEKYAGLFVRYSPELKKKYKNPYIIVDGEGSILDDAQGYGYDTVQKAQKAWRYKHPVA